MDASDLKGLYGEATKRMAASAEHVRHELSGVRTGRASVTILDSVHVEAYGMSQRLKDMAAITTPDATSIVVQPFDKAVMEDIRKAIQAANIGINPVPQGNFLRCPVPSLSGERRLELAKRATQMAEEGKVRVRNARRDALEALKKANKDKAITDDELKRAEKEIQLHTDKYSADIEKHLKAKEADLKG